MTDSKYDHVAKSARHLCDASDEVRYAHILSPRFVRYAASDVILNHIEFLAKHPPSIRARGLVVVGESGNGKTNIARAVQRRCNRDARDEARNPLLRVAFISLTGATDARTIYNRMLESLGVPVSSYMRISDRERLVTRLLRQAQTRALLLDEIQDVLKSTKRQHQIALDTVKFLMNEVGMAICAFGIEGAAEALRADPHLETRFDYKTLPLWSVNNDLRMLLAGLVGTMPLRKPSYLTSPDAMEFIINKTRGNLSNICRMVAHAGVFGVLSGKECIDSSMLEQALAEIPPAHILNFQSEEGPDEDK